MVKENIEDDYRKEKTVVAKLEDFLDWYCGPDRSDHQSQIEDSIFVDDARFEDKDFNVHGFLLKHMGELVVFKSIDTPCCWEIVFTVGGLDFVAGSISAAMQPLDDDNVD